MAVLRAHSWTSRDRKPPPAVLSRSTSGVSRRAVLEGGVHIRTPAAVLRLLLQQVTPPPSPAAFGRAAPAPGAVAGCSRHHPVAGVPGCGTGGGSGVVLRPPGRRLFLRTTERAINAQARMAKWRMVGISSVFAASEGLQLLGEAATAGVLDDPLNLTDFGREPERDFRSALPGGIDSRRPELARRNFHILEAASNEIPLRVLPRAALCRLAVNLPLLTFTCGSLRIVSGGSYVSSPCRTMNTPSAIRSSRYPLAASRRR